MCRFWALVVAAVLSYGLTAFANTSPNATSGLGVGFAYNPAAEIRLAGTVRAVTLQSVPGMPSGIHLLLEAGGRTVDVHLGSYVSREIKQAFAAGELVTVTGIEESVRNTSMFLARELKLNGHVIRVRNARGLLVQAGSPRSKVQHEDLVVTGGAQ